MGLGLFPNTMERFFTAFRMTAADTFGKILRLRLRMTERRGKASRRGCHPERNEVEPKDLPSGFGTIPKYDGKILRFAQNDSC